MYQGPGGPLIEGELRFGRGAPVGRWWGMRDCRWGCGGRLTEVGGRGRGDPGYSVHACCAPDAHTACAALFNGPGAFRCVDACRVP